MDDLETEGSFIDSNFEPWTLFDLAASNMEEKDCVVRSEQEATVVRCSEPHPFVCEWSGRCTLPFMRRSDIMFICVGSRTYDLPRVSSQVCAPFHV